jgi:ABC-type lipoprotein release transport system permease subunit
MWEFLLGLLFARATGISRFVRVILVLVAIGVVIAGAIYASVVLRAVQERSQHPHVHTHRTR